MLKIIKEFLFGSQIEIPAPVAPYKLETVTEVVAARKAAAVSIAPALSPTKKPRKPKAKKIK